MRDAGSHIQYGCGLCAPESWLNFDASPRLLLEHTPVVSLIVRATAGLLYPANVRFGDIVKGLPVADGVARGVYCSHVLEHLPRDDVPAALRNTFRMLLPNGVFRLVVPDLRWRIERYARAAETGDPGAADALFRSCALGAVRKVTMMSSLRAGFGWNAHLWMYDFAALKELLERAGFGAVRRCEPGDAADPMFALVEDRDRFFESGERELAIEAVKPSGGSGTPPRAEG